MGLQLVFIFLGIVLSWIFLKSNKTNELTIILAFLPAILIVIYSNIEKIKLLFSKIKIFNKTVSIIVSVKNTYNLQHNIEDTREIEDKLIENLLRQNIKIGKENNRIRIESDQIVKFSKDNNIKVSVPLVIYFQLIDNDKLVCKLSNSLPAIAYKEVSDFIRGIQRLWDFIDDSIEDSAHCKLKTATYNAKIKIDNNTFKNVYLAPYAPKYIKKLDLEKENSTIKLFDDLLEINSKSRHDFESEIKKYSSLFKNFFDEKRSV